MDELTALQERCGELLSAVEADCDAAFKPRLAAIRRRLSHERLKVLVVGEFSRGKSTLINALVGRPVLPARVTPTTATINVLNGNSPGLIRVTFADRSVQELPLPSEHVNKSIEGLVTTKNAHAHAISFVTLQIPGRLTDLCLEIVDTPGVNDLDEAREEITYRYLREADAAILLLDAQQPLNKSEKIFLVNKIFENDVRRVLFVVNKVDDVLSSGSVDDIPRIVGFVRDRLRAEVGIDAEVLPVSAKNALRARFRNEPDPGPTPFERFERAVIALAQHNAASERWPLHFERVRSLIRDQIAVLQQQCAALSVEIADLDVQRQALAREEEALASVVQRLEMAVGIACEKLSEAATADAYEQVQSLRHTLLAQVRQVETLGQMEAFRGELAARLRDLVRNIEQFAEGYREKMIADLEQAFRSSLAGEGRALERHGSAVDVESLLPPIATPTLTAQRVPLVDWSLLGAGDSVGSLLFGVVGFVAAIVRGLFLSDAERERRRNQIDPRASQQIADNLEQALAQLSVKARDIGKAIGASEAKRLTAHISDRAEQRHNSLQAGIAAARNGLTATADERQLLTATWRDRIARLRALENRCLPQA